MKTTRGNNNSSISFEASLQSLEESLRQYLEESPTQHKKSWPSQPLQKQS